MTGRQTLGPDGFSQQRSAYVERVNAVVDHIEGHLAEDLTLERLAEVAHFSAYHFHRIFTALVGETLSRFIARIRIERAATLLRQHPYRSVTDIAASCGFTNPSSFARSFRDAFGMSATAWRRGGSLRHQPGSGESYRTMLSELAATDAHFGIAATDLDARTGRATWRIRCGDLEPTTVIVDRLDDLEVAYVRHTGRYQGLGEVFADLFSRLATWAEPRGLMTPEAQVLAVYHDNPSITDDDKLRVSACLSVPSDVPASGDVGRMRVDGGMYAIGRFALREQDYGQAWFSLVGGWLPESGYEPDDRLHFERFPGNSGSMPAGKEAVDICLPVRPLRRY